MVLSKNKINLTLTCLANSSNLRFSSAITRSASFCETGVVGDTVPDRLPKYFGVNFTVNCGKIVVTFQTVQMVLKGI